MRSVILIIVLRESVLLAIAIGLIKWEERRTEQPIQPTKVEA